MLTNYCKLQYLRIFVAKSASYCRLYTPMQGAEYQKMDSITDEQEKTKALLQALKEGSSSAFEQIYNKFSGALYNYLLRISNGDQYLAEEVVQITFIRIWENRATIDPERSFYSFLATIAKNKLINDHQHHLVRYLYQENYLSMHSESDNFTEQEIEKRSLEEFIDVLINQLPPSRKAIFILSKKEHLTAREIAQKLGLSESTIETQLSLASKFMKKKFKAFMDKVVLLIPLFIH